MAEKVLRVIGLKKTYSKDFTLAVDDLSAEKGKVLTILGANGCGKSTLLRLINLLEKPDAGNIYIGKDQILDGKSNKAGIRKKMAMVFQDTLLFRGSVRSNIMMGLKLRGIRDAKEKVDYCLNKLDLYPLIDRNAEKLSGGERQRVSLARALVLDPELLLLDEPLSNIDEGSCEKIREGLFEILKDTGKTVLYVTHDRSEAFALSDNIAIMDKGRIIQSAEKKEILNRPKNEFIAKFLGAETLVTGVVVSNRENICSIKIEPEGKIVYLTATSAKTAGTEVALAIRPEDVVLYSPGARPRKTSAMNMVEGKITQINDIGMYGKIVIDCGFYLSSYVTKDSISRLKLCRGKKIGASIKATSIHVF